MLDIIKQSIEKIVLSELADWLNKAGRVFGDPLDTATNPILMREKYFRILGKLDRDGCNFILIMAKLVESSLDELNDLQNERDKRGVN
jgi:hypothetical protein